MSAQERKRKNDLLCRYIKSKLIMCNYSKQELATMLHMSLASVYTRLKNPDTFTRKELHIIYHGLQFTADEILQVE